MGGVLESPVSAPPRARPCALLKFGELALKGRNRPRFIGQLRRNVERAMHDLGGVELRERGGVLYVLANAAEAAFARARDVIGLSVVHPAVAVDLTPEAATATAVELLRGKPGSTFAVRARRRNKRFELTSRELSVVVGAAVQEQLGLGVDLDAPDMEIHLEVDRSEIFLYTERLPGQGGLPVGSSGRALVLMSGGIDSPVAAYRAMRRGLRCEFIHFSGRPFTGAESILKAYALVGRLDRFQYGSRLFVVQFGHAQKALAAAGAGRLQVPAQRRLMVMVASELARRERAAALVTGDSLGQVSSQTIENLAVVEAVADLPLLRPLIGWDKSEIIAEARRLGTFEVSELPDEDCCTMFSGPRAETHADPAKLAELERRIDAPALVERLVDAVELADPSRA
jgi:thiamine biosynthesis protein ThiI